MSLSLQKKMGLRKMTVIGGVLGLALLSAGCASAAAATLRNRGPLQLDEHAVVPQREFDGLQQRLDALAPLRQSEDPWTVYHLAKAQAWLEYAFDARAMRDHSGVMEEALGYSGSLIGKLEVADKNISSETMIGPHSLRLREDLWRLAEEMKHLRGLGCAASKIAQFEVQLVQAGHAYQLLGWRHSRPYLQAAERLSHDAQANALNCAKASEPVVAAPVSESLSVAATSASPPALVTLAVTPLLSAPPERAALPTDSAQPATLPSRVHFAFDRSKLGASSATVLDEVVAVLRMNSSVQVGLEGHADGRGTQRYNLALSKRRAQAVEHYLEHAGIAPERMKVFARGTRQPLSAGRNELDYAHDRRVDLVPGRSAKLLARPQQNDLQIYRPARKRLSSHEPIHLKLRKP